MAGQGSGLLGTGVTIEGGINILRRAGDSESAHQAALTLGDVWGEALLLHGADGEECLMRLTAIRRCIDVLSYTDAAGRLTGPLGPHRRIPAADDRHIDRPMSIVFVAGSKQISRLPAEVRIRLDTTIEKGFQILVGDANGADKAVQRYLADRSYPNVLVDCMKNHCRNNVGNWPTREVAAPRGVKGFDYYSLKDRAMAEATEYGLMLWDGKSKGTVNNVVNLSRDHKPVVVHVAPTREFRTIKTFNNLDGLASLVPQVSMHRSTSER